MLTRGGICIVVPGAVAVLKAIAALKTVAWEWRAVAH